MKSDLGSVLPDYALEDSCHFRIKINKLYWIDKSENNREDLCLHGDLEILLKNQIFQYSPTVSAAGLKLLRSLMDNHLGGIGDHLFPCCGNTLIGNESLDKVDIIGCDQGLDWSVSHKDGLVMIKTDEQLEFTIGYLQYKNEISNFAKAIEYFYKNALERILPEDIMDREGYLAFWNEWEGLKKKAAL